MRRIWIAAIAGVVLCTVTVAQPNAPGRPATNFDYLIGIEDVLNVRVWGEPDLSVSVGVRPDGKITVPLVNEIYVEDLSPMQVREIITERLANYIKEPYVTVIVEQINSFKVFVLGEVNSQGVLTFQKPTRLLQALAHAGGVTTYAKGDIVIIRESGGVETRITVSYKRLLSGDPAQENIFLKPGDTIIVGD
jgi:polysaccharide export outer membrane protein